MAVSSKVKENTVTLFNLLTTKCLKVLVAKFNQTIKKILTFAASDSLKII